MLAPARIAPKMFADLSAFSLSMLLIATIPDFLGQGIRDEEVDYVGLLLMTAAGYDPGDTDVFDLATRCVRSEGAQDAGSQQSI